MPFDLGFLGGRGAAAQSPAPSHGAGPGALGEVGRLNISRGYLDLQRKQQEHAVQRDYVEQLQKEKATRQGAIDAWLSAVRSGNRADIWVLGKRLKGMGINVQMPDAFSATQIPGETEAAGAAAPDTSGDESSLGFTVEEPGGKASKALNTLGQKTVGALAGPAATDDVRQRIINQMSDADVREALLRAQDNTPNYAAARRVIAQMRPEDVRRALLDAQSGAAPAPEAPAPFAPTRPDGTPIDPQIAAAAMAGAIPPRPMGGSPFGPGGPSAVKPPTATWRVSDPLTGTDIEIAPEQILADQEREIDQSFAPLIKMPDLDPVAQRAYTIGHEYAKGQLGFLTPKEAVKAGMEAADKYMMHMYRQGMVSAAQLRAAKKAGGGGTGGGAGGPSIKEQRLELAQETAATGATDKINNNILRSVKAVYGHEDYKKTVGEIHKLTRAAESLKTGSSLAERTAFRQMMTAVESRLSNADAAYYESSGGLISRLGGLANYVAGGGNLSENQVREIKGLTRQLMGEYSARQKKVQKMGLDAGMAALDTFGVKDPEQRARYEKYVYGAAGLPIPGGGGGGSPASKNQQLIKAGKGSK